MWYSVYVRCSSVSAAALYVVWNVPLFGECLIELFIPSRKASEFPCNQFSGERMTKRIFVGNLSYQTTEGDLTGLFEQAGEVESATIITDRDTGRSKGFGFVEMGSENAEKAIAQFNGTELNGRSLTVNEARPREERSNNRGGGRGGYGNRY
jgi:RNA recognition motif-containing protein